MRLESILHDPNIFHYQLSINYFVLSLNSKQKIVSGVGMSNLKVDGRIYCGTNRWNDPIAGMHCRARSMNNRLINRVSGN